MPTDRESVYLSKIADDYKKEADEALHTEFVSWLNGSHEENREPKGYVNGPGKPVRRYTDRHSIPDGSVRTIGDEWESKEEGAEPWQATWWGETSLTHLPGVREYLRQMKTKGMEADLQMNLLAEHGPQDLNQAWMYFKHWVKGRPVHENEGKGVQAVNLTPVEEEEPYLDSWGDLDIGRPSKGFNRRSAFGWQPPSGDGPPGSFGQSVHPKLDGSVSYDPPKSQDNRDELNEPRPGVKVMSVAQKYLDERTGELINAVEAQGEANNLRFEAERTENEANSLSFELEIRQTEERMQAQLQTLTESVASLPTAFASEIRASFPRAPPIVPPSGLSGALGRRSGRATFSIGGTNLQAYDDDFEVSPTRTDMNLFGDPPLNPRPPPSGSYVDQTPRQTRPTRARSEQINRFQSRYPDAPPLATRASAVVNLNAQLGA